MTLPLHARIRADLEAAILSGALAPGARVPTEQALMANYRCSRMTASKAVSALAAAGLIERRRRAGSFVARPRVHAMVLDVPDLAAEIAARGQAYEYRLHRRNVRAPDSGIVAEVALAGSGLLLALEGVHLADGRPLAVEIRLVALAAVPGMEAADLAATAPGSWLLAHVPWTEAETRISAEAADPAAARLLDVPPGTACLAVDRRTWRGHEGVTQVRQLFNGADYDLVARFGPRSP